MTSRLRAVPRYRRFGVAVLAIAAMSVLAAAPAGAATILGETFVPDTSTNCSADFTRLQTAFPGGNYAAPSDGVITFWSFEAASTAPQIKLKVGRSSGGTSYTIVGESDLKTPVLSTLNTYPVRIPVLTGDLLGLYTADRGPCIRSTPGYEYSYGRGDIFPGAGFTQTNPTEPFQLDVSATLEPDADNDGFGDETQDQCPQDASKQGDCAPPDTTITKQPKDKTKKKQATFEFTSSEPGSTFQCTLDGQTQFKACTSPLTVKVKKGKHNFQVQAIDQAGNADISLATDDWKVKKKK